MWPETAVLPLRRGLYTSRADASQWLQPVKVFDPNEIQVNPRVVVFILSATVTQLGETTMLRGKRCRLNENSACETWLSLLFGLLLNDRPVIHNFCVYQVECLRLEENVDFYCGNVRLWFQRLGLRSHQPNGSTQRSTVIKKKKKKDPFSELHHQSVNWMSLSRCCFGTVWEDLHVNLHMLIAKQGHVVDIFEGNIMLCGCLMVLSWQSLLSGFISQRCHL